MAAMEGYACRPMVIWWLVFVGFVLHLQHKTNQKKTRKLMFYNILIYLPCNFILEVALVEKPHYISSDATLIIIP